SQFSELLAADLTHAVVASQDCDIVAPVSTEACVDLLPATITPDAAPDLRYGKNPRRLCMEMGNGQFIVVDIRARQTIQKAVVATITPNPHGCILSDRKVLANWLGKRYSRPAFPDEFNARLEAHKKRMEKISKREDGKLVTAIFVMLSTESELPVGKDYETVVWLACQAKVAKDPKLRVSLEKYAQEFADAVNACDGIKVVEHELKSEFDISLEDLRKMKRFDFDYRSEAPKPGGEQASRD
ncbi:MAG TPA: hypothetical protein VKP30_17050, partial [Polyangiaceae bacterium]|nr:hypothetical protein [Polyangiaceae bacterium]